MTTKRPKRKKINMCALRDNAARYLRARSRPVLVSCEESQRVEISLSRSVTPSPLVTCTCICPAHHLSGTLHLRLRALSIRPQYICAYMTNKRPKEEKKRKKKKCALRDNAARYLRVRARPVLVSCEESQRVEISLSRSLTPSPFVTCTCICPAHHFSRE